MKVKDLIAQLSAVSPESEVFVWVDGDRYEATGIDPIDWYVDINVKTGEES